MQNLCKEIKDHPHMNGSPSQLIKHTLTVEKFQLESPHTFCAFKNTLQNISLMPVGTSCTLPDHLCEYFICSSLYMFTYDIFWLFFVFLTSDCFSIFESTSQLVQL